MRARIRLVLLSSLAVGGLVAVLHAGGGRGGETVGAVGRRVDPAVGVWLTPSDGAGRRTASGEATHDGNVARPPAPGVSTTDGLGWIEGEVVSDGVPFSGSFTVVATRRAEPPGASAVEPREVGRSEGRGGRSQRFPAGDGRFVLRDVSAGDYALVVTTPEGLVTSEPGSATVTDGRGAGPVTFRLVMGAALTGEVVGKDGRPLAGCSVWFHRLHPEGGGRGPVGQARTDGEGGFAVRGLGSGIYTVAVSTESGTTWTETVELQTGEPRRLHLAEPVPGRVRITVVDPDGRGLEQAAPSLTDASGTVVQPQLGLLRSEGLLEGRPRDTLERATLTDGHGVLLRYHVPPGRYRVSAWLAGWTPPAELPQVDVASNAVAEVTVTLTRVAGP